MDPVQLVWSDGTAAAVPALWLRDNCPCGECRVLATSERRKMIATEPLELVPVSITTEEDAVVVDWGTHVSRYSADWYRAIRLDVQRQPDLPAPWPAGFVPPTFSYNDLDESRSNGRDRVVEFLSSFTAAGVAIVTGVPTYPARASGSSAGGRRSANSRSGACTMCWSTRRGTTSPIRPRRCRRTTISSPITGHRAGSCCTCWPTTRSGETPSWSMVGRRKPARRR